MPSSGSNLSIFYVAFHYPPVLGSSGVHRTLAFTRHLDDQGWAVRVLTASTKAYHKWSEEQFSFIPKNVEVIRAYARDASRHFSWRGKYASIMSVPDYWQSWIFGGVFSGLVSVLKNRPDVIVSTYPIASAHIIGYTLHRLTGVPWVADLRDPMAQADYPVDPLKKRVFEWIERKIVKHCKFVMLTAPGAKTLYENRFPGKSDGFWQVVPNGFDGEIFARVKASHDSSVKPECGQKPYVVLHSGLIYPSERDPTQLFEALAELKRQGLVHKQMFQLRLRATGHDALFQKQVELLDIADLVDFEPSIPYMSALEEMLSVDGLLLLQADNCNYQVPAKAYEYIRAQKPVLALTPRNGDTGILLANTKVAELAPLDDKVRIKEALMKFLGKIDGGEFVNMSDENIERYSRKYQALEFEALLKKIVFEQT